MVSQCSAKTIVDGYQGMTGRENTAEQVKAELDALSCSEYAVRLSRFFKTGPGQYGEGDRFIGIRVPDQRRVAKRHRGLPLIEIDQLLASSIHEHRLTGLLILVDCFSKSQHESSQQEIVDFYLAHLARVNNWDLVDLSAHRYPHLRTDLQ